MATAGRNGMCTSVTCHVTRHKLFLYRLVTDLKAGRISICETLMIAGKLVRFSQQKTIQPDPDKFSRYEKK